MNWQNSTTSEISHLRKAIFYPSTGGGRDSYISVNNGGTSAPFKTQGVATHGNFMKFGRCYSANKPVSMDRQQRYYSDGTGRDNYISSKWNQALTTNQRVRNFKSTFRDGDNLTRYSRSRGSWRSNPEDQQFLCRKLAAPKRKQQKYAIKLQQIKLKLRQ